MSGAAVMGLVASGGMLAVLGLSALAWRRDSGRLRGVRANRWAKEADLALPDELVGLVAARVRREALVGFALMALVGAPVFGLATWRFFASPPGAGSLLHGPAMPLLALAVTMVVNAAGQTWCQRQEQRVPGDRIRLPQPVTLPMAVPLWARWAARALAVAPPLAAVAMLAHVQRGGVAHGSALYAFASLFVATGLLQFALERWQTAILNRPRSSGPARQLAIDDAFRIRAALGLVPLAPTLSYLASSLVLQTAYPEAITAQALAGPGPLGVWMPLGVAVFFFNLELGPAGIRRYYRRGRLRQPPLSPPPVPRTGSC